MRSSHTPHRPLNVAGSRHAVHRVSNLVLQLSVRQLRSMNKRTIFTDVKRSVGEAAWCAQHGVGDEPARHLGLIVDNTAEASTVAVGTNADVLCTRPGFTLGQIVLSQTKLSTPSETAARRASSAPRRRENSDSDDAASDNE